MLRGRRDQLCIKELLQGYGGSGDEVAGSVGKTSFWHLNQEKQPGWNRREAG